MHVALAKKRFNKDVGVLTPTFLSTKNWHCNAKEFPTLDVTFLGKHPVRLRLTCEQWDEVAPSIEILNADGTPYTDSLPGGAYNPGPHEKTGKPFICHPGAYEYHTHNGHLNDPWDNYRGKDGWNLIGILIQLSSFWKNRK